MNVSSTSKEIDRWKGSIGLGAIGVFLASGDPIAVQLTYNSSAQTLVEFLNDTKTGATYQAVNTGINLQSSVGESFAYLGFNGANYSRTFSNVNLATLLGSSTGYVGFTAAGATPVNVANHLKPATVLVQWGSGSNQFNIALPCRVGPRITLNGGTGQNALDVSTGGQYVWA